MKITKTRIALYHMLIISFTVSIVILEPMKAPESIWAACLQRKGIKPRPNFLLVKLTPITEKIRGPAGMPER